MSETVSIKIKLDDGGGFKTISISADDLAKAVENVRLKTDKLNHTIVNMSAVTQVASAVSDAFGQLNQMMSALTQSYAQQKEADTKLAVAMRNTMDATDAEIASIRNFIDAQERAGVVAGDVQTAAAQELATYLGLSSSLETIIPTMNDMIVQQLGINASADSAVQIATMLGKVMNGQTKALSRYGYEFSEAQEYILQFGNESERAAILCDVVGQSVGGMNAEMSKTDIGRQVQLSNVMGKIGENIGGVLREVQPMVSGLAQVGQSVTGVVQLGAAFKSLSSVQAIATVNTRMQAAAQKLLGAAGYTAAAGTTALKVATAALYATLSLGLTLAVQGLVELFVRLGDKGGDAAANLDGAADAEQAFKSASMDVRLALAEETIKLEELIKKKKDASKEIEHLNSTYGDIFGTHRTAAEWYDALTGKSEAYCRQLGNEAQARVLARRIAEKELEVNKLKSRIEENKTKTQPQPSYPGVGMPVPSLVKPIDPDGILKKQLGALEGEIRQLKADFDGCNESARAAAEEMGGMTIDKEISRDANKLTEDLENYARSVENAVAVSRTFSSAVNEDDIRLQVMKSGITSLISAYGLEDERIKQLVTDYRSLQRARSDSFGRLPGVSSPIPSVSSVVDSSAPLGRRGISTGLTVPVEMPQMKMAMPALSQYEQALQKYRELSASLSGALPSQADSIRSAMQELERLYGIQAEGNDSLSGTVTALGALSSAMGALSGVVDDSTAAWLSWGANVLQAVGQALPALVTLFTANSAVAETGAAASVASIPWVGPVLAIAAMASIAAAIAAIPKFAQGGIAYGPTLGVFGEYPGASSDPEVVAPLSKLTSLIPMRGVDGEVHFYIDGYRLKGILQKVDKVNGRVS